MMNIVTDAAGFVAADFVGDTMARALWMKVPVWSNLVLRTGITQDPEMGKKWTQLILGVVGGPIIRRVRILPKPVARYWEIANVVSALQALTLKWQIDAQASMGLEDWVTTARQPAAPSYVAPPGEVAALTNGDGLSDWATVAGSASYTGDTFSM